MSNEPQINMAMRLHIMCSHEECTEEIEHEMNVRYGYQDKLDIDSDIDIILEDNDWGWMETRWGQAAACTEHKE